MRSVTLRWLSATRGIDGMPLKLRSNMRLFLSAVLLVVAATAQTSRPVSSPELGANLPAQAVGLNDLIAVSVYDQPELSRTIRVGSDGFIRLPMLKQHIKAEGLYPVDLEAAIAKALQEEQLLVDPFVTVTVAQYNSRPISVAGAVKTPLVFQAEGPTTLLEAIARAGGLREDAGREILVSRSQPGPDDKPVLLTRRIPVRGLIDDADPSLNLKLIGGEEVRVPEVSKIYVVGNVKRPGAFPCRTVADTTVLQMLALAEGLMPFATKQAYIYRREAAGAKNEIPVALDKIMQRKGPGCPPRRQRHPLYPGQQGQAADCWGAGEDPGIRHHRRRHGADHHQVTQSASNHPHARRKRDPITYRSRIQWPGRIRPCDSRTHHRLSILRLCRAGARSPRRPAAHYLWILRRHKWRIMAFVCVCVAAVVIVSSRLTPIYESTATIDIDRNVPTGIIGQDAQRAWRRTTPINSSPRR